MKKIIACLLFGFSCTMLMAQACGQGGAIPSASGSVTSGSVGAFSSINPSSAQFQRIMTDLNSGKYSSAAIMYDDVEGSPYLLNESASGTLVMNNGDVIESVPLNYDLYLQEIIATKDDGDQIVLDPRYYQEVIIPVDGQEVSFKKVNPKKPDQFVEVLYESGDVAFFKEQRANLREGKNLGIAMQPSTFSQIKKYYVSGEDNTVAKVNLKKRDVFDHFPEMEAVAMREYLKTSKIKLSKEKDYRALFAALDD